MSTSAFSSFSVAPASGLMTVIKDILTINKIIQLHIVPWSPVGGHHGFSFCIPLSTYADVQPAYMKTNTNMKGGGISSKYYSAYANYLYMAVSDFEVELGHTPYSVAIQNEPGNGDGSYPTCKMSVDDMGQIGTALRKQLNNGGMSAVKIIGYEHNWVHSPHAKHVINIDIRCSGQCRFLPCSAHAEVWLCVLRRCSTPLPSFQRPLMPF
jgi:hypothetical protein